MTTTEILTENVFPSVSFTWLGMELNWPPKGEWLHWVTVERQVGMIQQEKRGWFVVGPLAVGFSNGERQTVVTHNFEG